MDHCEFVYPERRRQVGGEEILVLRREDTALSMLLAPSPRGSEAKTTDRHWCQRQPVFRLMNKERKKYMSWSVEFCGSRLPFPGTVLLHPRFFFSHYSKITIVLGSFDYLRRTSHKVYSVTCFRGAEHHETTSPGRRKFVLCSAKERQRCQYRPQDFGATQCRLHSRQQNKQQEIQPYSGRQCSEQPQS